MGRLLVVLMIGLLAPTLARTATGDVRFSAIQSRMQAAVADRSVPSITVAVIEHGKVVWLSSAGWADIAARRLATPHTVYRIGSVSKAITGTVASIAESRGEVDLSEPVTTYLPGLVGHSRGHFGAATLSTLLDMSAGMTQAVHYRGIGGDASGLDEARFVSQYALAPSPPGPRFLYSNMGPELVARSIAAATRQSFTSYMLGSLLEPLGMTETFLSIAEVPPRMAATSYWRKLTPIEPDYDTDPISGAGYLTSAGDLAKFAAFHLTGAVRRGAAPLGRNELAATRTPREGAFYHRGWARIGSGDLAILMSDGQVNGGEAVIMLAPGADAGVVVLTNVASDVVYPVALATLEMVAPGAGAAFDKASAELEKRRDAEAAAYYPPKAPWAASGSLTIDGQLHRLEVATTDQGAALLVDGAPMGSGKAGPDDDGFAVWKLPCPKLLPACIDGTEVDATLSLTRGGAGYDGVIAVDSNLGLFPYEVHLVPTSGR